MDTKEILIMLLIDIILLQWWGFYFYRKKVKEIIKELIEGILLELNEGLL